MTREDVQEALEKAGIGYFKTTLSIIYIDDDSLPKEKLCRALCLSVNNGSSIYYYEKGYFSMKDKSGSYIRLWGWQPTKKIFHSIIDLIDFLLSSWCNNQYIKE